VNKPLQAVERLGLYFTVALTGAAVMVIELLGTRVIAPFYGVSLYVWSSLISVTMIALAVGYFVGGRWADRAQRTGLSLVISLAGVFTLAIPWAARSVLLLTDPMGLRAGAFVSALILFFPSLTFLGMAGPFAIKMVTSQLDRVGTSAGSIYAVSTLGSVIGTLLLGFYLFPLVGTRHVLIGLGLGLLLLAVFVGIYERTRLGKTQSLVGSLLFLGVGLVVLSKALAAGQAGEVGAYKLRSEQESLYGWVRVFDRPDSDLRLLMSDASTIGASRISDGASQLTYQAIVPLIPAIVPVKRALLVGLGAGHMALTLRDRFGIATDTLEIDPAVARAAEDYFGFRATGQALVGDARYEIRHLHGPYDLIIHDCFTGGSEPAHLLTVETLTQLRSMLSDQGILALNFVAFAQGGQSGALPAVAKTVAQVFPYQTVLISDPGRDFNDFVFLASAKPIDLNAPGLSTEQVAWLKQRVFAVDADQGIALTDDFNPLEHLQTRKAEHYRSVMVEWFGADLLVR
jgi:spermidine synthase